VNTYIQRGIQTTPFICYFWVRKFVTKIQLQ
jgi:hypothetical protein